MQQTPSSFFESKAKSISSRYLEIHRRMNSLEDGEEASDEPIMIERKAWWKRVRVEPVLFLYMMAFMLTSVVEDAFFVYKACRANAGLPEEECRNISHSPNKDKVQVIVANFRMYENIASQGMPVILAFYVGSWSDHVGRKLPLLVGLAGNLVYSVMIVVNALQESWTLEWVLWTAFFPCSLTGSNLTVFMAAFSYLADTTSQDERTLRTTILEVAYLLPMPIGIAIGSYLFNKVVNHSYATMFMINSAFLVVAILYALVALEWKTASTPIRTEASQTSVVKKVFRLLFQPIVETLSSLFQQRDNHRRLFLILVLFSMALYTFQRDEKHIMYLYAQKKFLWDVASFSNFRTFQSILYIFGLLVGIPLMTKVLNMKDMMVILVGAVSHSAARVIFATANNPDIFKYGAIVGLLGPTVAPVLRSVVSKLVPPSQRGKTFAMFSVSDNAVPLISGVVYSQLYIHTINTFPQAFFLITIASQVIVFLIALFMHLKLKEEVIIQAEEILPDAS